VIVSSPEKLPGVGAGAGGGGEGTGAGGSGGGGVGAGPFGAGLDTAGGTCVAEVDVGAVGLEHETRRGAATIASVQRKDHIGSPHV
jgi:hypothetical protein